MKQYELENAIVEAIERIVTKENREEIQAYFAEIPINGLIDSVLDE